jgi:hypothetical protein
MIQELVAPDYEKSRVSSLPINFKDRRYAYPKRYDKQDSFQQLFCGLRQGRKSGGDQGRSFSEELGLYY